ncbi:hypothetical protein BV898_07717 [Hypsibius exemplaris]|uniref:Uncharacterized protein n=1 Tax=Hypsibius exemplaris TaxID=2072580 RepID=A0A1W0WSG5_HYPEX|nr:hypothetical protein BV898_07717 [Hypsibius exemplaris]
MFFLSGNRISRAVCRHTSGSWTARKTVTKRVIRLRGGLIKDLFHFRDERYCSVIYLRDNGRVNFEIRFEFVFGTSEGNFWKANLIFKYWGRVEEVLLLSEGRRMLGTS